MKVLGSDSEFRLGLVYSRRFMTHGCSWSISLSTGEFAQNFAMTQDTVVPLGFAGLACLLMEGLCCTTIPSRSVLLKKTLLNHELALIFSSRMIVTKPLQTVKVLYKPSMKHNARLSFKKLMSENLVNRAHCQTLLQAYKGGFKSF